MRTYRSRYHLDRDLRLLAHLRQVSELVVHHLCTANATMQDGFGQHHRNHRKLG